MNDGETSLATDPATGEIDGQNMQDTEGVLNVAAGSAKPTAQEAATLLELGLYYILGDLERARAWVAFIDAHAALDAEEVRSLSERA
jgi:hypothetical protein